MSWYPASDHYEMMEYRRCVQSELKLPAISLGLWYNFRGEAILVNMSATSQRAFDLAITHFGLANNYRWPYGSVEENFGHILENDFNGLWDEMIMFSKAGNNMWPGPSGELGSCASKNETLNPTTINNNSVSALNALNGLVGRRGQTLAQMALASILRGAQVTSVLNGTTRVAQVKDYVGALGNTRFTKEELTEIDILADEAKFARWATP